jgi:uncharacterized protein
MGIQQAAELYADRERDLHIYTCKGRKFYLSRPTFDIEEIAHSTSMQCRYTGHVKNFYSVAEHEMMVARLIEQIPYCQAGGATPYEGLLHDAHEGYISDIASPWKTANPGYREIEEKVEGAMRAHFGLPPKITEGVKRADWLALFIEGLQMLPGVDMSAWLKPDDIVFPLAEELAKQKQWKVANYNPYACKLLYLSDYALRRGQWGGAA